MPYLASFHVIDFMGQYSCFVDGGFVNSDVTMTTPSTSVYICVATFSYALAMHATICC